MTCETAAHGGSQNCVTVTTSCNQLAGTTTAAAGNPGNGVPAIAGGVAYSSVCHAAIDCFHRTKCAGSDGLASTDCFCGVGVDSSACFAGTVAAATGPCKAEVMAAADSNVVATIGSRFNDGGFPIGVATQMMEVCDHLFCATECLQ